MYSNYASTSIPTAANQRPIKRRRDDDDDDLYVPISMTRPFKRSKSENVTQLRRYLIGCASVIYTKNDARQRDSSGRTLSQTRASSGKKGYAPSSDLAQSEMVEIYFDGVDRTVVSQSKGNGHEFAPPNWAPMEAYVFPWIRANRTTQGHILTRLHIKHVAFRVMEYLATKGLVTIKYSPEDTERDPTCVNVAMGGVRGWWWESDGDLPQRYMPWVRRGAKIPGTFPILNVTDSRQLPRSYAGGVG